MPGFQIQNNDINSINNKAEFKRAHRWRVTVGDPLSRNQWLNLESCSRPSFEYKVATVHHDQEEAYFAGKQAWTPIQFSFYDLEDGSNGTSNAVYRWIAANNIGNHSNATVNPPSEYKNQIILELTDGQGNTVEKWTLFGAWAEKVEFGALDYKNNEILRVKVTVRYDRAVQE